MDWEKQDNEIRRMMEGEPDFLPESFDATRSWNKLQGRLEPASNKRTAIWWRMAAAASLLIALMVWWQMDGGNQPGRVVQNSVENSIETVKPETGHITPGSKPEKLQTNEMPVVSVTSSKKTEEKQDVPRKLIERETPAIVQTNEKIVDEKSFQSPVLTTVVNAGIDSLNGTLASANLQEKPNTGTAKPAKSASAKMRVVHINHLQTTQVPSPPVFVKVRHENERWPAYPNVLPALKNEKVLEFKIPINTQ